MTSTKILCGTAAAAGLGLAVAFSVSSATVLSLLTQASIYALFAVGVGVLLRQNGMVSFGHALWFGASGYMIAILLQAKTVPAGAAILVTVAGLATAAFVVGLLIVRVPGVAFGMLTLAIGQMAYLSASRARGVTGGADGISVEWPSSVFGVPVSVVTQPAPMFALCWVVLVLTLAALAMLLRGRFGAITEAARDNEERARFIGIRTLLPRASLYALSAAISSLAGVLSCLNTGFVSPESLHWSLSGVALMMVVVGGTTVLWGPAFGAAVYFLAKSVLGDHSQHWMGIFGVALIVVIVFAPQGLSGMIRRIFRLHGLGVPRAQQAVTGATAH